MAGKKKISSKDSNEANDSQFGYTNNRRKRYGHDAFLNNDYDNDNNVLIEDGELDPRESFILSDEKSDEIPYEYEIGIAETVTTKSEDEGKNLAQDNLSEVNIQQVNINEPLNEEKVGLENEPVIENASIDSAIIPDENKLDEEKKNQDVVEVKSVKPISNDSKVNSSQKEDAKDKVAEEETGALEKVAVNKESTSGYIESLNTVKPVQFIEETKDSAELVNELNKKETDKAKEDLPELEQPTGLPLRNEDKVENAKPEESKENVEYQPEGNKTNSGTVEEKHSQNTAPLKLPPLPKVNNENSDASFIKGILSKLPSKDPGLNSEFGPVPKINLDGQSDPQQNEKFYTDAVTSTNEEELKANSEVVKDFGENNVFPDIETEVLSSHHEFSESSALGVSNAIEDIATVDAETLAKFDNYALNKLDLDRQEEIQKTIEANEKKDSDIEKANLDNQAKIAEETLNAKSNQIKEQKAAKESVELSRKDWQTENAKVKSDFETESALKKKGATASIDDGIKKADADINQEVKDADTSVTDKTKVAEDKAKAEKAKADKKPKGFWDRVTDAVSDFFDAIKAAINSIFNALRALVKTIIEAAKKAVNKLIDAVKDLVIGLIKAFGEALKMLVKIALFAFPKLRDKFIAAIDKAVEVACDVVNTIAEGLKKAVNVLLDALGAAIDLVLAAYQTLFNLAIDALKAISVGMVKVLKFLAMIAEKVKQFGQTLIEPLQKLWGHPEIIEQAAQETLQPYIDKIPAQAETKLSEGLQAVGLNTAKHVSGIMKYLAPALSHLAANWWSEAKKMIWYLIWPFAEGSPLYTDAPKLWNLIPQIWNDVLAGEFSKATDGCLEWMQALNMTLGAFSGWIAIAAVVVGAVVGGVAGAAAGGVGAVPGAVAGAGAGLQLAVAVGEGLMVAMIATEAAILTKAIYDLLVTTDDGELSAAPPQEPPSNPNNNANSGDTSAHAEGEEEAPRQYASGNVKTGGDRILYAYQRIATSVITLGIMGALLLLGAIGGMVAKGLGAGLKKISPKSYAKVRLARMKVKAKVKEKLKPLDKYKGDFNRGRMGVKAKLEGGLSSKNTALADNKALTGAKTGDVPTPESLKVGTVKMEEHPNYAALMEDVKQKGFEVEYTAGDPHVAIHEIYAPDGTLIRVEKKLYVNDGMRYLDLEHEVGHINQLTGSLDGLPTEKFVQRENGKLVNVSNKKGGVLTNKQNTVTEYHNRLKEYIRLKERGASESLLAEHEQGLKYWRDQYQGAVGKKYPDKKLTEWKDQHFSDIGELESKLREMKSSSGATTKTPDAEASIEKPYNENGQKLQKSRTVEEIRDGVKSKIKAADENAKLKFSDEEIDKLISEGRAKGLSDEVIEAQILDDLKVNSKTAAKTDDLPEEIKNEIKSEKVDKVEEKVEVSENEKLPERPLDKLSEPNKVALEKLEEAGLKVVEEGNVIKLFSEDGRLLAEIENGQLRFKYDGYGGDVVMDPVRTTTVLGKFFEDISDPTKGTRHFLGSKLEPPVKGAPEGSFSRGEGKGTNPNGMNFLDIKEAEYNALMEKNIKKYQEKGFSPEEADILGRKAGNQEFWDTYNLPFLEDAFKRGDNVRLVSDPTTHKTGTYSKELDAIEGPGGLAEKYGYKYDVDTKTYKKILDEIDAKILDESKVSELDTYQSKLGIANDEVAIKDIFENDKLSTEETLDLIDGTWEGKKHGGTGYKDGEYLNRSQKEKIKKYIAEHNVELVIVDKNKKYKTLLEYMDFEGIQAGFDGENKLLILRKKSTRYEAFHELQHFEQWKKLGNEEYKKLSRLEKETYVYEQIMVKKYLFKNSELEHAKWYINFVREKVGLPPI